MSTTNKDYVEKFDQLNSTSIAKLIWIAGCLDNSSDLEELLSEIPDKSWNKLFPEFGPAENQYFEEYANDEELVQLLIEYEKFGFIAEIMIPECSRFEYDGERLIGWSTNLGIRRVEYVYAETIEELYAAIEKKSEEVFEDYKQLDLRKQQPQTQN